VEQALIQNPDPDEPFGKCGKKPEMQRYLNKKERWITGDKYAPAGNLDGFLRTTVEAAQAAFALIIPARLIFLERDCFGRAIFDANAATSAVMIGDVEFADPAPTEQIKGNSEQDARKI
jgi:hypothetical protein